MSDSLVFVTQVEQLRDVVAEPIGPARDKVRTTLDALDLAWLAASPFCAISTSDAGGNADVSPKGDPPGFTYVLDEKTIVVPDRPGNRRVDGFLNVLANPHVGLLYLVPGRGDTLRINGRARLLKDAPFFDDMIVKGNRPALAMLVDIDEVFYHCSKAFLRSKLWDPDSWHPEDVPSRAEIAKTLERKNDSIETLTEYYGPSYGKNLYG
ncbi:MAG: class putative FMN-dependent enzyme [Pseudonocardiales bacterium]|nr:class putative FMN-dependent enzyme [Pseudonocardiales bacterium]